ncbi:MAG TPA: C13 family peptidase, partial [Candidatus Dormibacteraeota bacterium]|nr:C13 family peptidase [Candidatus Dormibacteraeota bacterium]
FIVSLDQVAALLILNLAVWALLDALHAEKHAPLALDGLFGWACYLLLLLGACTLVSRANSAAAETRALLVPALAASPFVLTVFWLASDLTLVQTHVGTALIVATIYLAVLIVRVLGAAYALVRLRAALVALALLLVSPWAITALDLDTRLWVAEEPQAAPEEDDAGQTETLFYDQPAQIAAAVARVQIVPAGKPAVYFVGFAGDGDQEVFRREAQFASEAFAARYGSAERSVLLVNDVEDRDSYPLASLSGLGQTLKVLAGRMRADEDVLVLFLTSHGSQAGLEVENGTLPLAQLSPQDLREVLDASGIRYRVLVVSACYAGVFIDELKTETTAIITAADASHTSFGCDDDRDLTWFGEAFLKDALPGSASLEDAFHKAAALVSRREDEQHETHSNPQLYLGPLMRTKLGELPASPPKAPGHSLTVER